MIIPLSTGPLAGYAQDRFALCFTCHDYVKLLGPTAPYQTNFQDDGINRHLSHVSSGRACWDSDLDYLQVPDEIIIDNINAAFVGDSIIDSRMSCPACHNVHGSPNPAMIRHGELISTPGTHDKSPALSFRWYKADGYTPAIFRDERLLR